MVDGGELQGWPIGLSPNYFVHTEPVILRVRLTHFEVQDRIA